MKSVDNSERELRLAHEVETHLCQRGTDTTDVVCADAGRAAVAEPEQGDPYCTALDTGQRSGMAKPEACRELGRVLGTLHTCCTGLELPEGIEAPRRYGELPDRLERQLRRVRFMGKNIRRKDVWKNLS